MEDGIILVEWRFDTFYSGLDKDLACIVEARLQDSYRFADGRMGLYAHT